MRLNTRTQFESLTIGQWLSNTNGYFEVCGVFSPHTGCVETREVLFLNDDADEYTLSETVYYETFTDLRGSDLV